MREELIGEAGQDLQLPRHLREPGRRQRRARLRRQLVAVDATGNVIAHAKPFEEDIILIDLDCGAGDLARREAFGRGRESTRPRPGPARLRPQMRLQEASSLGLSGGIDSAADRRHRGRRPRPRQSPGRRNARRSSSSRAFESTDARSAREAISASASRRSPSGRLRTVTSSDAAATLQRPPGDVAEENLQARIRGSLLMAISNKFGAPAALDRQQERAGRRLLHALRRHGGGLAVIGDVPKTLVYRIAKEVVNPAAS